MHHHTIPTHIYNAPPHHPNSHTVYHDGITMMESRWVDTTKVDAVTVVCRCITVHVNFVLCHEMIPR